MRYVVCGMRRAACGVRGEGGGVEDEGTKRQRDKEIKRLRKDGRSWIKCTG